MKSYKALAILETLQRHRDWLLAKEIAAIMSQNGIAISSLQVAGIIRCQLDKEIEAKRLTQNVIIYRLK